MSDHTASFAEIARECGFSYETARKTYLCAIQKVKDGFESAGILGDLHDVFADVMRRDDSRRYGMRSRNHNE
jgi:hypothetical protein